MNPTLKAKDCRDTDYKFAENIGLKFITGDELFDPNHEKLKAKLGKKLALPDLSEYKETIRKLRESVDDKQEEIRKLCDYIHDHKDQKSRCLMIL